MNNFRRHAYRTTPLAALLLVLVIAPRAIAHDDPLHGAAPKVPDATLYAPTPMPDRIVLTWCDDPRTTQAVTWRTSTDVTVGVAELALAEGGPGFKDKAKRLEAITTAYKSDISRSHVHKVVFTELTPGTRYVYRVGDGVNWSEWFQFRTAADTPEPFSFVYFGDAQTDIRSMWSRVIRQAHVDAPRAAFMLHAGDLVTLGENDALWGEWFAAGSWINAMIPVLAAPGNHEYVSERNKENKVVRRWLTRHWATQFNFPRNGPEGLESSVYYIDYQNLRIICLNSNEKQEEQAVWLDRVLSESTATWNVLFFHHPIYSMAKDRDNATLRSIWKPVIDRHSVDLVLTGHDHTYGRSELLMPERNVETGANWKSAAGTVYVVSVSGPKMYKADMRQQPERRRQAENTQLYQVISIDGPRLRYEARTATGDLHDAFELRKRPGKPNEMTELPTTRPAAQAAR